jgi:catechol-2,3-dioxygenase
MPVQRLNHAVLYVRDVERSAAFYANALSFRTVMALPGAVFLQAPGSRNDHDLGLFHAGRPVGRDAGGGPAAAERSTVGLYHLAWEVDTLDELDRIAGRLAELGALAGASDHSTTKAIYARDPDDLEFEVSWLVPAQLLTDETLAARAQIRPLDIAREKARYGGATRGGIGVSVLQ